VFGRNPVFERELRRAAGSKPLVLGLLAVTAPAAGVLWMFWPRTGVFSVVAGGELFSAFMGLTLAAMSLLAPAASATAVTDERERSTFPLLLTTQLSPVDIGLGKLFAVLATALLMLAVVAPIVALCAWAGGVSVLLLGKACAVLAAAVITYSLFGLAVSAAARSNAAALWMTYVGILVLTVGVRLPSMLGAQSGPLHRMWLRLRVFSPFEAMMALNWAERYDIAAAGNIQADAVLRQFLQSMAGISACAFLVFVTYLFRSDRQRKRGTAAYSDAKRALRRKLVFPFYLIDPLRRRKPIGRRRNPVAVVELRSKVFGHPKFIARTLSVCFIGSLWLLFLLARQYGGRLDPDRVRLAAVLFQLAVVVFLAPLVAAGSISEELTSGTFLLLRLTLLPAWRIVIGKLKAALVYVTVFLASSLPVLFTLAYLEPRAAYWRVGAWTAILLATTLVLVSFGLLASSLAPSTAAATIVSYVFALALNVAPLAAPALGDRIPERTAAFILAFNPGAAAMQVCSDRWFADMPSVFGNRLWQNDLILLSAMAIAFLVAAGIRIHWLLQRRE